ncbi:hypothetical protein ACOTCL_18310 [Achromobacter xylosoxidans]
MDSTIAFDKWLSDQFDNGLVDIKFAIVPGKDVSPEAVKAEILTADALIKAGVDDAAPLPTSGIPDHIQAIISNTALH